MRLSSLCFCLVFLPLGPWGCARTAGGETASDSEQHLQTTAGDRNKLARTIVHLFEWTWDDIAKECERLANDGVWAVQISPPQEHAVMPRDNSPNNTGDAFPWYQRYQPVSYKLESRSGTQAQLAAMIATCHEHGVKIIADAVINHMASNAFVRSLPFEHEAHTYYVGLGNNDTLFGFYPLDRPESDPATRQANGKYFFSTGTRPGSGAVPVADAGDQDLLVNAFSNSTPQAKSTPTLLYGWEHFHHNGEIQNYSNADHVWNGELGGLPDLETNVPYVQDTLAAYLNRLLDVGVDGLRIDAAKHVAPADIAAVLRKLKLDPFRRSGRKLFVYSEVLSPCESVKLEEAAGEGFLEWTVSKNCGEDPRLNAVEYRSEKMNFGDNDGLLDVHVMEMRFSAKLGQHFSSANRPRYLIDEPNASIGPDWGFLPSEEAIIYTYNHDSQWGHGIDRSQPYLNYRSGNALAANLFQLAYPYGTPLLLSSYTFGNKADGNPNDQQSPPHHEGSTLPVARVGCLGQGESLPSAGRWVCEHRFPAIRGMIRFRVHTADAPAVVHRVSRRDGNLIGFGRSFNDEGDQSKSTGFVVINNHGEPFLAREYQAPGATAFRTGLPPGLYCNVLTGGVAQSADSCGKPRCVDNAPVRVDAAGRFSFSAADAQYVIAPGLGGFAVHTGPESKLE